MNDIITSSIFNDWNMCLIWLWRNPSRRMSTYITYPHNSEEENTVNEENDNGRCYVDPIVAVGHYPRTTWFQDQRMLQNRKRIYRFGFDT